MFTYRHVTSTHSTSTNASGQIRVWWTTLCIQPEFTQPYAYPLSTLAVCCTSLSKQGPATWNICPMSISWQSRWMCLGHQSLDKSCPCTPVEWGAGSKATQTCGESRGKQQRPVAAGRTTALTWSHLLMARTGRLSTVSGGFHHDCLTMAKH